MYSEVEYQKIASNELLRILQMIVVGIKFSKLVVCRLAMITGSVA
jgi:hypothetical protein